MTDVDDPEVCCGWMELVNTRVRCERCCTVTYSELVVLHIEAPYPKPTVSSMSCEGYTHIHLKVLWSDS